jgi:S-DNA-T family DNA segregation ATPase FtsK/SpoIIIE
MVTVDCCLLIADSSYMAQKRSQSKSAATRSTKSGSTQRKSSSRSPSTRKSASRSSAPSKPWLSPQQQRELFAFALIGLGLLLLVLLGSANRGVVGAGIVDFVQQAFGNSGIVLPILFVVVGGLILWQERFVDAPVTGGNVTGVVLLALVLLSATEFRSTAIVFEGLGDPPRSIGGAIDLGLMHAFGVAGAFVLLALVCVLGIMLTFNVTLRQILSRGQMLLTSIWRLVYGETVEEVPPGNELTPEPVPYAEELKQKRGPRPLLNGRQPKPTPELAADD